MLNEAMPIYIRGGCRIDWGWKDRTAAERKIARAYHHRLDDDDHGLDSFGELLAEASVALLTADI